MNLPSAPQLDTLAAEFVLGTLRGPARRRFERWRAERPEIAQNVREWEDRLVGLTRTVPPVQPAASTWRSIEQRLALRPERSWLQRAMPYAAGLVLAALLGILYFATIRPTIEWQPAAELVAANTTETAWQIESTAPRERLRITARQPLTATAGTAYELWALPDGGAPVSLGLLPQDGTREVELTAVQRTALARSAKLAVSREPAGGSPTGAPTGPVVITADLAG